MLVVVEAGEAAGGGALLRHLLEAVRTGEGPTARTGGASRGGQRAYGRGTERGWTFDKNVCMLQIKESSTTCIVTGWC